jgi:hypothetical protein
MTENNGELSSDQKLAINNYVSNLLRKWLSWLGAANLVVLAVALIYIFFILPGNVFTEVVADIDNNMAVIQKKAMKVNDDIVRLDERAKNLSKNALVLQNDISNTKNDLKLILEETQFSEVANLLRSIKGSKKMAALIVRIGELENRVVELTKQIEHTDDEGNLWDLKRLRIASVICKIATGSDKYLNSSNAHFITGIDDDQNPTEHNVRFEEIKGNVRVIGAWYEPLAEFRFLISFKYIEVHIKENKVFLKIQGWPAAWETTVENYSGSVLIKINALLLMDVKEKG